MEAEDPLESVSGTNGLTGAADTIMVLDRRADGPKLYGRGRDIEDFEKALKFKDGVWTVLGDSDDVKRSEQQRAILQVITDATGILTPAEIAKESGVPPASVRHMLARLVKDGKIEKNGHGQYKLAGR
jgi:predicted Rossmann fold nucleotide-binding protein DprA/Smf involved in DNA uptake